jgi:phospholipid/cholesterol/gamma-HCH transport system ATP-binding protein
MSTSMQTPNNEPVILVKALRKSFGQQTVLDGVDLTVVRGETLAVLGRSGTGKSVLLKLLIGLRRPDSGSIRIHGQETTALALDRLNEVRKTIGFLFQQAALYDSLTVEENVAFPLNRHTRMRAPDRRDRVRELLASVGMEEHAQKMPSQISGGMQKRVGLARALALEPDIVLFDEPTTGLDPITAKEIGTLILTLKQERRLTAVVVTHDIRGAKGFSDRFMLLHEGHIVADGAYGDLQKSQDEFVVRFLKADA